MSNVHRQSVRTVPVCLDHQNGRTKLTTFHARGESTCNGHFHVNNATEACTYSSRTFFFAFFYKKEEEEEVIKGVFVLLLSLLSLSLIWEICFCVRSIGPNGGGGGGGGTVLRTS